ncbi:unnamed protein product [Angiostrongylus costaricensis]|uniref:Yippee domain-containing protein n=1 Tax=Angiostrongylus costaricensis TaxID=334426 RepID=A0A0R3PMC9_ANGCS|nr:unnamed protein product [Angiostrongylus costaricensis]
MSLCSFLEWLAVVFVTGSSGRAMLFHRVWNLDYSTAHHRDMTTGKHIVRDVMCRICHRKIGWMYEFAMEDSQRYKESRVILEKALVDEVDGFRDPAGALETHDQPPSSPKFETFGGRRGIRMPRIFLEHWGGRRTFSCEKCGTYLSNRQEVVSTRFSGRTGKAFLFRRVANVRQGIPVLRKLTTGNHLVSFFFTSYFSLQRCVSLL